MEEWRTFTTSLFGTWYSRLCAIGDATAQCVWPDHGHLQYSTECSWWFTVHTYRRSAYSSRIYAQLHGLWSWKPRFWLPGTDQATTPWQNYGSDMDVCRWQGWWRSSCSGTTGVDWHPWYRARHPAGSWQLLQGLSHRCCMARCHCHRAQYLQWLAVYACCYPHAAEISSQRFPSSCHRPQDFGTWHLELVRTAYNLQASAWQQVCGHSQCGQNFWIHANLGARWRLLTCGTLQDGEPTWRDFMALHRWRGVCSQWPHAVLAMPRPTTLHYSDNKGRDCRSTRRTV